MVYACRPTRRCDHKKCSGAELVCTVGCNARVKISISGEGSVVICARWRATCCYRLQLTHKLARLNEWRTVLVSGPLSESMERGGQPWQMRITAHWREGQQLSRVLPPTFHALFPFMSVLRCIKQSEAHKMTHLYCINLHTIPYKKIRSSSSGNILRVLFLRM